MFNRHCGLHHPGNTVPCCRSCNTRTKNDEKFYHDWETHLGAIIEEKGGSISELNKRKKRIMNHMDKWAYPNLSSDEENAIAPLHILCIKEFKRRFQRAFLYIESWTEPSFKEEGPETVTNSSPRPRSECSTRGGPHVGRRFLPSASSGCTWRLWPW